jgi:hypothetical protein
MLRQVMLYISHQNAERAKSRWSKREPKSMTTQMMKIFGRLEDLRTRRLISTSRGAIFDRSHP